MGLEAVKEEIIRSAKENSSALIAEARREANRISKEADKKIGEMKGKSEEEARKSIELIKRQQLAAAELESKKMMLDAKKQAIDSAFKEAKARLENLDEKKRELSIKNMLERAGKEIEISHVYCNKKDAKFMKGIKTENDTIIGGFIAENGEKTVRVDYSFETMLESIKEKELQNISKILFD